MNSKQKLEENGDILPDLVRGTTHITSTMTTLNECLRNLGGVLKDYDQNSKPAQYQIGIDTFARAEANMTKDEILACCRFNIDKYTWRKKDQDLEDFKKIIAYAEFGIKQLEKNG